MIWDDGRTITIETGKLAKQADGAVEVRMGNTMLLATVVSAKEAGEGVDFMPLQVEYKERYSSIGRFPGGFTRREGRASDYEILTARLVDRALRPLFPDNYHADTFVNVMLFSSDGKDMPDALAGLAASAALAVSDIPFNGPISEVRVARIDGQFKVNPTFEELERADMDIMVGATYENIMMVEGEMNEVSEADLLAAMKFAHDAIKIQCQAQMELAEEVGSTVKREYCHEVNDEELRKDVWAKCYDEAYAVACSGNTNKHARGAAFDAIVEKYLESMDAEEADAKSALVKRYYHDVEKRLCVAVSSMRENVSTVVQLPRSVLSGAKWIIFPDLTAHRYLPAVRHNRSRLLLSVPNSMRKSSMMYSTRAATVSCYTIISRLSLREKPKPAGEWAVAK